LWHFSGGGSSCFEMLEMWSKTAAAVVHVDGFDRKLQSQVLQSPAHVSCLMSVCLSLSLSLSNMIFLGNTVLCATSLIAESTTTRSSCFRFS
jgi:hypothetical protein